MPNGMLSAEEFAGKIKAAYPDYASVPDQELTAKILQKYPDYQSQVLPPGAAQARAAVAKPLAANLPQTVTPQPGEDFNATMDRAVQAGKKSLQNSDVMRMINTHAVGQGIADAPKALAAASIPAIAAAPGAAAGATLGGSALGYLGQKGAEAAGASPATAANISGAGQLIGGIAGGVGGAKLQGMLPSAARAGAAINDVKATVGDHTIDVSGPGNAALRAKQLADSGGGNVKIINDFIKRTTDPNKGPLTFAEARDFYSNSTKLTAAESMSTKPVMKAAVTAFNKQLGDALTEAAGRSGKAEQYTAAMKEYNQAKNVQAVGNKAVDYGKKAALGVGSYEILKKLGLIH